MQNPKTGGNRFNPDIRPSEIDTYTETNGEQTAEYKIINAHPIINGILNKLAFFRTHAAAVYYNRLANKTVKQKFDDVDAAVGELNEKLILEGDIKSFGAFGDNTYQLVLSGRKADKNEPLNTYQLVLQENGGAFGHQDGQNYTTLWWIATTNYVDDRIKIIESTEITLNTSTTISYTLYSLPAPSGYRVVSREFIRLDDGTYNVLIFLPLNHSYIVHMSTGAHTIKGKVLGLCVKS